MIATRFALAAAASLFAFAAGTALASSGFPAGAVAVFDHDGDWADLAWGSARLVAFHA